MGNAITAAGGFFLASRGALDPVLFASMLSGLCLIIASACVFNNYMDRHHDQKMARTRNRPLARQIISTQNALCFALLLGLAGSTVLACTAPPVALAAGLFGALVYLLAYTKAKYRTTHGTLIGSVAGATPPVVGYTAVTGSVDGAALALFAIVVLWQMPHFFAIALFRSREYAAAAIPVLPVVRGAQATKVQILLYTLLYLGASVTPTFLGYTGYGYLVAALLLGIGWLWVALEGFKRTDNAVWARKMFRFSLIVITGLCIALSLDATPL